MLTPPKNLGNTAPSRRLFPLFVLVTLGLYKISNCRANVTPKVAIVIPARMRSSRLPGKPLVPFYEVEGISKTLLQCTWEAAASCTKASEVYVATEDDSIFEAVCQFGGEAIMTSNQPNNGSERCAEALLKAAKPFDIIVNWQVDAPLICPEAADSLIEKMLFGNSDIGTIGIPPNMMTEFSINSTVLMWLGLQNRVLSFQRALVRNMSQYPNSLIHVGIYAFRQEALFRYCQFPQSDDEIMSNLEQIRMLRNDMTIDALIWDDDSMCVEVNTAEDLTAASHIYRKRKCA